MAVYAGLDVVPTRSFSTEIAAGKGGIFMTRPRKEGNMGLAISHQLQDFLSLFLLLITLDQKSSAPWLMEDGSRKRQTSS